MLELFDKNRKKIAILQNAFNIIEEIKINSVSYFTFSLLLGDAKNDLCQPFNYIRYNNGELYRIMPISQNVSEKGYYTYKCEHVFALLIDNVMFGQHIIGNIGVFTKDVINYILNKQITKNWILDTCEYSRQFEYAFEQENLLSALFSVVSPFSEPYIFEFNTKVYPYRLSLKKLKINAIPSMYIRQGKNMLSLAKNSDTTPLCTRIYPLGEGEGVNQLNITEINNNLTYLQSPQSIVDKYGIIERIWIDRRYTDKQSLKAAAQAMLNELQEPYIEYDVDFAILGLTKEDNPEIGQIVQLDDGYKTYITGITFNHDEIPKSRITIANKPKDVANMVADMADRQRIEMAYSQGATQFFPQNVDGNADQNNSMKLKIFISSELKIINFVNVDIEISGFRKPFKVTGGGGGQVIEQSNTTSSGSSSNDTTSSGGGQTSGASSTTTTSSGGGQTSGAGGGINQSTSSGGIFDETGDFNVKWQMSQPDETSGEFAIGEPIFADVTNHSHKFNGNHYHTIEIPDHNHAVEVSAHAHTISAHTHDMKHTHNISSHTHSMWHTHDISHTHTVPNHTHNLEPGIETWGNPQNFKLVINGKLIKIVNAKTLQQDITTYLLDNTKKIPRNTYHTIEVFPNIPAYVMITANVQGFIQSRGNNTV